MTIQFGKLTNKLKIDKSQLAEVANNSASSKSASIFSNDNLLGQIADDLTTKLNTNAQNIVNSFVSQDVEKPAEKEITFGSDNETITEDYLDEAISDEYVEELVQSALKEAENDIPTDEVTANPDNYLRKSQAINHVDGQDSFVEYAALNGINLKNVTNTQLTQAYNDYTDKINTKNKFEDIYKLMSDNLPQMLQNTINGTDVTFEQLYNGSQADGAFNMDANYNNAYSNNARAAIDSMRAFANTPECPDTVKAKIDKIVKTYENQADVSVGLASDATVNINREIDEKVAQQGTGDCYLLATLNSLSKTPQGQEIIKNAITNNNDGSYTVNFAGVGRAYTFNTEELRAADSATVSSLGGIVGSGMGRYSEGDDDAMLIELALEQFREQVYKGEIQPQADWPSYVTTTVSEESYNAGKSALTSGNMSQVMYLLTGQKTGYVSGNEKVHSTLDEIKNDGNSPYAMYASVYADNGYAESADGAYYKDADGYYKKVDGKTPAGVQRYNFIGGGSNNTCITLNGVGADKDEKIDLTTNSTGGHALTVTAVTDDTITIINPWDSEKEVTVNRSEFEGYIKGLQYLKLS